MIVVDTNILAHFWLPSDHTELCEQLFQWDPEWIAPVLWKSEFRNVVILYMRKKRISYKTWGLKEINQRVLPVETRRIQGQKRLVA